MLFSERNNGSHQFLLHLRHKTFSHVSQPKLRHRFQITLVDLFGYGCDTSFALTGTLDVVKKMISSAAVAAIMASFDNACDPFFALIRPCVFLCSIFDTNEKKNTTKKQIPNASGLVEHASNEFENKIFFGVCMYSSLNCRCRYACSSCVNKH